MAQSALSPLDAAKLMEWHLLAAIRRFRDEGDRDVRDVRDRLWQYRCAMTVLKDEVAEIRAMIESTRATCEMILAVLSREHLPAPDKTRRETGRRALATSEAILGGERR
jgi:hypothetical protein